MKIKGLIILAILFVVGVIVWAKTSAGESFSLAKKFPKDALVYAQVSDLPEFVRLIGESQISEKYLESINYADFQNSHLGIKLAERLQDISKQTNVPIDLTLISSLSEKQAAVALYDVGKLDLVFVSPMNEALFSATMFVQNAERFNKENFEDDTVFYRTELSVDRNRQKQNLIFANINGYFVLATNEKLFLETQKIITSKQTKNRLYDEVSFNKLSERITPNLATIWINQEKLNSDYYFRRYWLMSDVENLKNIQAGIFDISLDENGLTEKREFLLKEAISKQDISSSEIKDLMSKIPEDIPLFQIKKADEKQLSEAIYQTLFDKESLAKKRSNYSYHRSYFDDYYYQPSYYYLNSNFDEVINEKPDDEIQETEVLPILSISNALNSAQPSSILIAAKPKLLENPLFTDFQKLAIIKLNNPKSFNANSFENSIVEILKKRVTVVNSSFFWSNENGLRKLNIPLIGWEISYKLNKGKLFISNSIELLNESLSNQFAVETQTEKLDNLTVIRLINREENFDQILNPLADEDNSFIENIGSLLDVLENVKQIEVRRKYEGEFMIEEIFYKTTELDSSNSGEN